MLGEIDEQSRILGSCYAMADPLRGQMIDGIPHGLRPGCLTGVGHAGQAQCPRPGKDRGELRPVDALFGSAEAEADTSGGGVSLDPVDRT